MILSGAPVAFACGAMKNCLLGFAFLIFAAGPALAWDYPGHRIINQLALAGLPADFPAFVRTPENAARIAFLAGEPDRWRNVADLPLRHDNAMDHYIDLEQLAWAGLDPARLSPLRYEFALQFAAGRSAHAGKFPFITPEKDADHVREWPGFLPWAIIEYYDRLKSAFSYLKAYEEAGTPVEIANAQANIVYLMGVMGHFVGDGSQPLHTTVQTNGWIGPNPNGYTTWKGFHAWIDGGFIAKAGIKFDDLAPSARRAQRLATGPRTDGRDPVFVAIVDYLGRQHEQVGPLYELDKAGKLRADGTPGSLDGKAFIEEQLLRGSEMLASLWVTAWRDAPEDAYLHTQLLRHRSDPKPDATTK